MSNIVKHDRFKDIYDKVPGSHKQLLDVIIQRNKNTTPIGTRDDREQANLDIVSLAIGIAKDYGIKEPDGQQTKRFFDVMMTYYKDLTASEIKLAFTLGVVGALKAYLPDGDNSAYGDFSLKFTSKILNAYRRWKADKMSNIRKLLPAPEFIITEEEKRSNSVKFIEDIKKWFEQYKQGVNPDIFVIEYTYSFLKGSGLIPRTIDISEEEVQQAINAKSKYMGAEVRKHLRILYKEMINEGNMPSEIRRNAFVTVKYKAILRSFDNLIQNNESIGDYL